MTAAGTGDWTALFTRSRVAPTVFTTAPAARPAVRGWLAGQTLARAEGRTPHAPALDAWAVLDGGVLSVARWSGASGAELLAAGFHVVGFRVFRLLTAALGVPRPTRPLPGEPLFDLDALQCAHAAADPRCPDAREQAELLATCTDARSLRLVAGAFSAAGAGRGTLAG